MLAHFLDSSLLQPKEWSTKARNRLITSNKVHIVSNHVTGNFDPQFSSIDELNVDKMFRLVKYLTLNYIRCITPAYQFGKADSCKVL